MAKKTYLILALAALLVLLLPSAAFANWAIHGGYVSDTDACAGCHRAHSSVSSITWDAAGEKSALLVSNATRIKDFCYACHDNTSQGAETDVQDGVYGGTNWGTNGAALNGGGFDNANGAPTTSTHMVGWDGVNLDKWGAYGGGPAGVPATMTAASLSVEASGNLSLLDGDYMIGAGNYIPMDCTACHDPHGSSNYRLLKDVVNGNPVGGYEGNFSSDPDPNPTPYVVSAEVGYPTNGFRLHVDVAAAGYQPDYTKPQYAKAPDGNPNKGMSGWCAGCHTTYNTWDYRATDTSDLTLQKKSTAYNSGDGWGVQNRHRHPINSELANFNGQRELVVASGLPLDNDLSESGDTTATASDWIECLTCHYAHGTNATMTGFANVASDLTGSSDALAPNTGTGGTPVTGDSALLRRNNRGVCEACHNK